MKHKFHGAFARKTNARTKSKRVGGSIKRVRIAGKTRYLVIKRVFRVSLR